MSDKTIFALKIILIILVGAFIASNIWNYSKNIAKAPVKQVLEDAHIAIIAPVFERNTVNDDDIKDSLFGKVKNSVSYRTVYDGIEYSVRFTEFTGAAVLASGVESIKNHFRDNNFKYETIPNKVSGLEGILIKGSFQRRNKKYGIRQQLIKKGNNFWQILAIFEDSDKNNAEADKYINSVSISDLS